MDWHRWLLAISAVIGLQMTAAQSSFAHIPFSKQIDWATLLEPDLFESFLDSKRANGQSALHQANTILLNQTELDTPHELTIDTSAPLDGQISIDGKRIAAFSTGVTTVNLAPHLKTGVTTVEITGKYAPRDAPVRLQFNGAGILIQKEFFETGTLEYRLDLEV